jgi:hypothetical protein
MASIDYRLSNEAIFPAPVEDVKTSIRWLKTVAQSYCVDLDRIGLMGSSAGGHLAVFAATSGTRRFEGSEYPDQNSPWRQSWMHTVQRTSFRWTRIATLKTSPPKTRNTCSCRPVRGAQLRFL